MNPNPFQQYNIGQKALITHKDEALVMFDIQYGDWTLPGGRIDENEDPEDGFHREVIEEVGIDLNKVKYKKELIGYEQWDKYKKSHDGTSLFLIVYKLELEEKPEIKLSDEHTDFRWITKDEICEIEFVEGKTREFYELVLDK